MLRERGKEYRGLSRVAGGIQVYLTGEDGRRIRRSCGNLTPRMADLQRAKWQAEILEGKYFPKTPRVERPTFAAIADAALEHAKAYKRGWDCDAGRLAKLKEWFTGLADEVTTEQINGKLLAQVQSGKWTETTSNEYRVVLARAYNLAIDAGKLIVNPAKKAHRYKLHNARERELSYAEENRLRASIRKLYAHKEPELDLGLHLGCRRSNLYGIHAKSRKPMAPLDWKDVDLRFRVVHFPRAKAGDGYTVPLNRVAVAALQKLRKRSPDGSGPVIRKPSGLSLQSCRKWFEQSLADAQITNFHWHDLRHTFACRLRRKGVAIEDIAALLDHNIPSLRMVTRYAHANLDALRKAVAKLEPRPKTARTATETARKTASTAVLEFRAAKAL